MFKMEEIDLTKLKDANPDFSRNMYFMTGIKGASVYALMSKGHDGAYDIFPHVVNYKCGTCEMARTHFDLLNRIKKVQDMRPNPMGSIISATISEQIIEDFKQLTR